MEYNKVKNMNYMYNNHIYHSIFNQDISTKYLLMQK